VIRVWFGTVSFENLSIYCHWTALYEREAFCLTWRAFERVDFKEWNGMNELKPVLKNAPCYTHRSYAKVCFVVFISSWETMNERDIALHFVTSLSFWDDFTFWFSKRISLHIRVFQWIGLFMSWLNLLLHRNNMKWKIEALMVRCTRLFWKKEHLNSKQKLRHFLKR